MKKTIMLFCMAVGLFATNAFAQEVRGVETRRADYAGDEYYTLYCYGRNYNHEDGKSNLYIGFEFKNLNSISVSVTIEVYLKGNGGDKLIDTKDIVLKTHETYIHKFPKIKKYQGTPDNAGDNVYRAAEGRREAEKYYVKYKAYKLH